MTSRSLLVSLRTWLLPVAIGAGAFCLHYALHIPAGPLPPPSPAQLEERKKQAEKDKKEAEKKQRDEDRKAGKRPTVPERTGPRDFPYEAFTRPRPEFILAQLREYYGARAFKSEPVFEAWQTAHKSLIGQIVSATRQLVLPDGPPILVTTSECHTIRCRFTLSASAAEPLETISAAIVELQLDGRPLWFAIKPAKVVEEPSKRAGVESKHKLDITVSFMRDLPPMDRIQLPGKGPLRQPPKPPATNPSATVPTSPSTVPVPGKPPAIPTHKPVRTGPAPDPIPK